MVAMLLACARHPPVAAAQSDGENVASAVRRQSPQLIACFDDALARVPKIEGRIEIEWTIVDGGVAMVRLAETTIPEDGGLAACIVHKIGGWTFDPSISGDIQWPFVFRHK
jgi:hypothetical protein